MILSGVYFALVSIFTYIHALQAATLESSSLSSEARYELRPIHRESVILCEKLSYTQIFHLPKKPDTIHSVTVFKAVSNDLKTPLIVMAYSTREALEREYEFSTRIKRIVEVNAAKLYLTPVGIILPTDGDSIQLLAEKSVKHVAYFGALIFEGSVVPFVQYMNTLNKPSRVAFVTANMDVLIRALATLADAKIVNGRLLPSNLFVTKPSGKAKPSIKLGNFAFYQSVGQDFPNKLSSVSRYFPPELIPPPSDHHPVMALKEGSQYHSAIDAWSIGIILMEQLGLLHPLISQSESVADQLYMTFHYLYPGAVGKSDMAVHCDNVKKAHDTMAAELDRVRQEFMIQMLRREYDENYLIGVARENTDQAVDELRLTNDELIPVLKRLKPTDRHRYEMAFTDEMAKQRKAKKSVSASQSGKEKMSLDGLGPMPSAIFNIEPKVKELSRRFNIMSKFLQSCREKPFEASTISVPHLMKLVSADPEKRLWFLAPDLAMLEKSRSRTKYFPKPVTLLKSIHDPLSAEIIIKVVAFLIFLVAYCMF